MTRLSKLTNRWSFAGVTCNTPCGR